VFSSLDKTEFLPPDPLGGVPAAPLAFGPASSSKGGQYFFLGFSQNHTGKAFSLRRQTCGHYSTGKSRRCHLISSSKGRKPPPKGPAEASQAPSDRRQNTSNGSRCLSVSRSQRRTDHSVQKNIAFFSTQLFQRTSTAIFAGLSFTPEFPKKVHLHIFIRVANRILDAYLILPEF
jgi:hypothetical protein